MGKKPFLLERTFTCTATGKSICLLLSICSYSHTELCAKFLVSITSDIGDAWTFWISGEFCFSSLPVLSTLPSKWVYFPKCTKFPKQADSIPQTAGHVTAYLRQRKINGALGRGADLHWKKEEVFPKTQDPKLHLSYKSKRLTTLPVKFLALATRYFWINWSAVCCRLVFLCVPKKTTLQSLPVHRWRQ